VKNTIDTIDTPRWMQTPRSRGGGGGFQRPKWMGGNGNDDNGARAAGAPAQATGHGGDNSSGRNILGFFGGRNEDGRIMI